MDDESWEEYADRLKIPETPSIRYFYRHVLFDHASDLSARFPWFRLKDFDFCFEDWTARAVHDQVRFDRYIKLDEYQHQIAKPKPTELAKMMIEAGSWPEPIVIFDFQSGFEQAHPGLNRVHLIEGHHRTCFLRWLFDEMKIDANTSHKLLVLRNCAAGDKRRG